MIKHPIFTLSLVFLAGFVLAGLIMSPSIASASDPIVKQTVVPPQNRVSEDQIYVYPDRVILDVSGVEWASFANTNSMSPFFDEGSNALQIVPKSPVELSVGDIVSYSPSYEPSKYVIHRIVDIGYDENGVYYILKGDNNVSVDPDKVRFEQIDRVLIGIIY